MMKQQVIVKLVTKESKMFLLNSFINKSSKVGMLALWLLFSSFVYGDSFRELVQDESRVILAVENMT
jgi:hypothetical protein